ncbi:hypothetical protein EZS27_020049 [termite gut metagenome]|uniref:Uncharacterized protein n=1 Tax=termite gut metagenome TaxID=433724 RepID=A0A5J4RBW8_9ZZZZ
MQLIGERSFNLEQIDGYGIIKKLSSLFIEDANNLLVESGLNHQAYRENERDPQSKLQSRTLKLESIEGTSYSSIENKKRIYFFSNYKSKQPFFHYLTTREKKNPDKLISYNDIFKECPQSGNNRGDRKGGTKPEGFYKQTKYRMEGNYTYCLFMQTSETLSLESNSHFFASLGGDQSLFKVTIVNAKDSEFPSNPIVEEEEGIVKLISHSYIKSLSDCYFSALETIDFRYIQTESGKTKNYSNMFFPSSKGEKEKQNSENRPTMSRLERLVSKGSVFYCKNAKKFVEKLNKERGFQTIGYNHYEIIYL